MTIEQQKSPESSVITSDSVKVDSDAWLQSEVKLEEHFKNTLATETFP